MLSSGQRGRASCLWNPGAGEKKEQTAPPGRPGGRRAGGDARQCGTPGTGGRGSGSISSSGRDGSGREEGRERGPGPRTRSGAAVGTSRPRGLSRQEVGVQRSGPPLSRARARPCHWGFPKRRRERALNAAAGVGKATRAVGGRRLCASGAPGRAGGRARSSGR